MGRWVTSKGRRIYIPDDGEENPFEKNGRKGNSNSGLSKEQEKALDSITKEKESGIIEKELKAYRKKLQAAQELKKQHEANVKSYYAPSEKGSAISNELNKRWDENRIKLCQEEIALLEKGYFRVETTHPKKGLTVENLEQLAKAGKIKLLSADKNEKRVRHVKLL